MNWAVDTTAGFSGRDVAFVDALTGWECGSFKIRKTTDGGITWVTQLDTLGVFWVDIMPLNSRQVWAISREGAIARTTNGGATWTYQSNPSRSQLRGISFGDSVNGIITGFDGIILRTSDGGATWTNVRSAVTTQPLFGIHFLNAKEGWVAGWGGTILKTTNGGATWDSLHTGANVRLYDTYFVDSQKGWAVGNVGAILRTTDGGSSWTGQASPIVRKWTDIEFSQYPIGWIIGNDLSSDGRLLRTSDGGDTWIADSSLLLTSDASSIQFTSLNVGWLLMGESTGLYRTTNGGNTWEVKLPTRADTGYTSFRFIDDLTGWVCSNKNSMYSTTNGGSSWRVFFTPEQFSSVWFADATKGWGGTFINGEIYRTTDSGERWVAQQSPYAGASVYKIFFSNSNHGWAIGENGAIIHTANGGATQVIEGSKARNVVSTFSGLHNYPNPFNGQTVVKFFVHKDTEMGSLEVYDILGRKVFEASLQSLHLGLNSFVWDGKNMRGGDLSSGVFLCRVTMASHSLVKKMLLIR
jgi:photosystem II stability/assembly factor-like uncharacterized protein